MVRTQVLAGTGKGSGPWYKGHCHFSFWPNEGVGLDPQAMENCRFSSCLRELSWGEGPWLRNRTCDLPMYQAPSWGWHFMVSSNRLKALLSKNR